VRQHHTTYATVRVDAAGKFGFHRNTDYPTYSLLVLSSRKDIRADTHKHPILVAASCRAGRASTAGAAGPDVHLDWPRHNLALSGLVRNIDHQRVLGQFFDNLLDGLNLLVHGPPSRYKIPDQQGRTSSS
jgi:hypothetical protein